jgi:hypothetical protein
MDINIELNKIGLQRVMNFHDNVGDGLFLCYFNFIKIFIDIVNNSTKLYDLLITMSDTWYARSIKLS